MHNFRSTNFVGPFISNFHEFFIHENLLFALCSLQTARCAMSMGRSRSTRTVNRSACSHFTASVNLLVTLPVLYSSKMNPGRIEILFAVAGSLNVSPLWAVPSSTCMAAIYFNSSSLMSQPLMSECTSSPHSAVLCIHQTTTHDWIGT